MQSARESKRYGFVVEEEDEVMKLLQARIEDTWDREMSPFEMAEKSRIGTGLGDDEAQDFS